MIYSPHCKCRADGDLYVMPDGQSVVAISKKDAEEAWEKHKERRVENDEQLFHPQEH